MKAYSNDLRLRAVRAVEAGEAVKSIAQRLEVSDKWVYKIAKQYRETKHYEVRKSPGRPRKLKDEDLKNLAGLIEQFPDATLQELKEKGNLDISISSLNRYLREMKITFKKKQLFATEQKKEEVQKARADWAILIPRLDPTKLVFLDESSANTAMTRLYGRAFRGTRIYDYTPDARWHSVNILSALRIDGTTESMVYSGSLTGPFFKAWVENCLCPTLREGDIVVMDNLSCHKVDGIEAAIRRAKASLLYLPAYSPDLNPIEKMWAKIKAILRGLGLNHLVDYGDMLLNAIRDALNQVTADDAAGWFQCCGYSSLL